MADSLSSHDTCWLTTSDKQKAQYTRLAENFCSSLYSEASQAFHFSAAVLGLLEGSALGGMAAVGFSRCLETHYFAIRAVPWCLLK